MKNAHHGELEVAVKEGEEGAGEGAREAGRGLGEEVVALRQVLPYPCVQLRRHVLRRTPLGAVHISIFDFKVSHDECKSSWNYEGIEIHR